MGHGRSPRNDGFPANPCWPKNGLTSGPSREYLHGARAECYFYGRFTQNELAFTPSQNTPYGGQTLGYRKCVNISLRLAQSGGTQGVNTLEGPLVATTILVCSHPTGWPIVPTLVQIVEGNYGCSNLATN